MAGTPRRFRYSLEMLLKQRQWEKDAAAAQEHAARGVFNAHLGEAQNAAGAVARGEDALREALQAGASIDPRYHQSVSLYLAQAREALRAKAHQAARSEALHEQARRELLRSLRAVRALERHKENRQHEHHREREQIAQDKQDELWLTGRRTSWR